MAATVRHNPSPPAGPAGVSPTIPATDPAAGSPPAGLTRHIDRQQGWQVDYPADQLRPEKLSNGITLFISPDRRTVAAIDSYPGEAGAQGNTGEGLRNRARDTTQLIYSSQVQETGILAAPRPWETGLTFTTGGGSRGEAVYGRRDRSGGPSRIDGIIIGWLATAEAAQRPMLLALRDSFRAID